jgi:hypothetical protein
MKKVLVFGNLRFGTNVIARAKVWWWVLGEHEEEPTNVREKDALTHSLSLSLSVHANFLCAVSTL